MVRGSKGCIIQDANSLSDWGDTSVTASAGVKRDGREFYGNWDVEKGGGGKWIIFNGGRIGGNCRPYFPEKKT